MSSEPTARYSVVRLALASAAIAVAAVTLALEHVGAQQSEHWPSEGGRRFYQDDPLWTDADMRDIAPVAEFDLSKSYEFVNETFGGSGRSIGPAQGRGEWIRRHVRTSEAE